MNAPTTGSAEPTGARRVTLYTPLPPARTGTAAYAALVLRDLAALMRDQSAIRIAVPAGFEPPDTVGFPVLPYAALPNVIGADETRIFCLANNGFHDYIHAALADLRRLPGSRVIVLSHDPCCGMLLNALSYYRKLGFSDDLLLENLSLQYGSRAPQFLDAFRSGALPPLFEFVTHAMGPALTKADEIWSHSLFGMLKLGLESTISVDQLPAFRLIAHPDYHAAGPEAVSSPERFVVGAFGWVSPPKRILSLIDAFYRFLCRRTAGELDGVHLRIVGALDGVSSAFDPVGRVESLDIGRWVTFYDYVTADSFDELQADCSLFVNLRYPSCGETSGTLKHATEVGRPVIATAYQACREGAATDWVPPLAPFEIEAVASVLERRYDDFRRGVAPALPQTGITGAASVAGLLAREVGISVETGERGCR